MLPDERISERSVPVRIGAGFGELAGDLLVARCMPACQVE